MTKSDTDTLPLVYIILVNWNGWRDTICCLESVLRLTYPKFHVVICDNDSSDGSIRHIQAWARGEEDATLENASLARLIYPPVAKPLPISFVEGIYSVNAGATTIALIPTGANLYFAGGSNRGMMHALEDANCSFVWLLNNDTLVEPDALIELVKTAVHNPEIGICGSLLRSYESPSEILTMGGRTYNSASARSRPIRCVSLDSNGSFPDYIEGASMLVRRTFIETIGFLEESYTMYFEELDWTVRAEGKYQIAVTPKSVVYHKEGASSGGAEARDVRSNLAERFLARNRILFTRRFYPFKLPLVAFAIIAAALHRVCIGKPSGAWAIARGFMSGFAVKKEREILH